MVKQNLIFVALIILLGCQQATVEKKASTNSPNELAAVGELLDSIHIEDQKYRGELEPIIEKYGWQSAEVNAHWDIIGAADTRNLVIVEKILSKYGWLSKEQVGGTANSTLFLVIQHSDQATQEKYLPMMRQAVKDGKANSTSLALLEDRINLGKGELQVYGSQVGTDPETGKLYVLPLIEPEKVNERRATVGLGPIEEYISHWDLEWDVEAYKKNLPKWIEKLKQERA